MLPAAVLLLSLSASDPTAVLVTSKRTGAESYATKLAARVHTALPGSLDDAAASAILKKAAFDPRACQGATECHAKAAKVLGEHAVVVGIDVGKIAKTLAVHIEAVAAGESQPFGVSDFSVPADKWAEQSAEPIATFAKLVAAHAAAADDKVQPLPDIPEKDALKPAPKDAPTTGTTTAASEPVVAPPVFEHRNAPPPSSSPHVLPWIMGGATLASFAVSGVFLVLGLHEKSVVDGSITSDGLSTLTETSYDQHKLNGNHDFTIALSTVILGAALAVITAIFFVAS